MSKVLIVGAGGVGGVVAHKCAQVPEVFSEILLASRTVARCEAIRDAVRERTGREIGVAGLDADQVDQTVALIRKFQPELVINVALPYQDLAIMDACLETGVAYLDTANYEPPDTPRFEYKWQWAYQERFKTAGLMALLGSGFDPGVTNVFCAYAARKYFDEIHYIDILDCNAGDHGHPFATNFNPEINIREITQPGRYWEDGEWKEIPAMSESMMWDYPEIGPRNSFLLYHEELESLVKNIHGLRRIRFFMTFGEQYLTHLRVLQNVGMTSIEPVMYEGHEVVPLKFLKQLLPDPGSLGENYKGKTNIGCVVSGIHNGSPRKIYIYNVCDHEETYREVGAQAVSYTTGVPAMIGAKMMLEGKWSGAGVFNMEELDPEPFMEDLNRYGLPWKILELEV
ncbi:MAG: saccharopine dehydrogenase family protein [Leptospiraceae bacterium]|nr:saccharopine dehydrogenase family protein [Leptospiraceae bacterium]MCB1319694.1 saccharopine dehydrogenase family protein [Leptospiraceae bacterium]